ncbi:T9SS type A sorting domain-containing protein [Ornithobacterium rhinotracheale]|uniref:T9SS type A sorting domain-containing protein n=1 Tax=Ornithobacterium rhinotracheale TaxID=28251 RepID=UPI001FF5718E|nr:T9SS type A sorting domain-containing protein [Ornithobacterium rhinotracheale]MCK0205038.1 T9SS type A sorting domain-containing protein [Ornithobacterium rhinotracheale]
MKKYLLVLLLAIAYMHAESFGDFQRSEAVGYQSFENKIDQDRVKLSPNPAVDTFKIYVEDGEEIKGITVYSILGNVVFNKEVSSKSKKSIEINISNLKKGKYLVKVFFADNSSEVKPLIKQ